MLTSGLKKIKNNSLSTPKNIFCQLKKIRSRLKYDCYKSVGHYHSRYESNENDTKSYWDTIYLVYKGVGYSIYYEHPRYSLSGLIEDESYNLLMKEDPIAMKNINTRPAMWREKIREMWENVTDEMLNKVVNKFSLMLGDGFLYANFRINIEIFNNEHIAEFVYGIKPILDSKKFQEYVSQYPNYSKEQALEDKDLFSILFLN